MLVIKEKCPLWENIDRSKGEKAEPPFLKVFYKTEIYTAGKKTDSELLAFQ